MANVDVLELGVVQPHRIHWFDPRRKDRLPQHRKQSTEERRVTRRKGKNVLKQLSARRKTTKIHTSDRRQLELEEKLICIESKLFFPSKVWLAPTLDQRSVGRVDGWFWFPLGSAASGTATLHSTAYGSNDLLKIWKRNNSTIQIQLKRFAFQVIKNEKGMNSIRLEKNMNGKLDEKPLENLSSIRNDFFCVSALRKDERRRYPLMQHGESLPLVRRVSMEEEWLY